MNKKEKKIWREILLDIFIDQEGLDEYDIKYYHPIEDYSGLSIEEFVNLLSFKFIVAQTEEWPHNVDIDSVFNEKELQYLKDKGLSAIISTGNENTFIVGTENAKIRLTEYRDVDMSEDEKYEQYIYFEDGEFCDTSMVSDEAPCWSHNPHNCKFLRSYINNLPCLKLQIDTSGLCDNEAKVYKKVGETYQEQQIYEIHMIQEDSITRSDINGNLLFYWGYVILADLSNPETLAPRSFYLEEKNEQETT